MVELNRFHKHALFQGPISRALIVDDIRVIRKLIEASVAKLGIETLLAADGYEAFELLCETPVDVIITDIEMPRWSGLDLLAAVRRCNDAALRSTPVIVTSSLADRAYTTAVRRYEGAYFLAKPVALDQLRITLQMIATSRSI